MRGRNELILYLDYDGVLHHSNVYWSADAGFQLRAPERYILFQHVELLEALLQPYPLVEIVLSTSWVHGPHGSFEVASNMLSPELQRRIIGRTIYPQTTTTRPLSRGQQVLADVELRLPRDWLALDDDDDGFERHRDHLVHCDQYAGLTGAGVANDFSEKLKKLVRNGSPRPKSD